MRKLANGVRATRKVPAEVLSVYSTLPKVRAAQTKTLAKFEMKKRCVGTVRRIRKKTERFKRREGEILVKKGCNEGGGSL